MVLRLFFILLLIVHGLIHFIGFAKAFSLANFPQLTQSIGKTAGLAWLAAGVLFIVAGVLFFVKEDFWWLPAAIAVVVSQILIIANWQDTKFGAIANVIAIAGIMIGWAIWNFNTSVRQERATLLNARQTNEEIIEPRHLAALPPVIQQWLTRANVVGRARIHTVFLHQSGEMRTTPDGKWAPFTAEQYFTTEPPGFVWTADVRMTPWLNMRGIDTYRQGQGHMLIKALALVPVVNVSGAKIDQGTMLRYLGEICWFPTAALSPWVHWEQLNDSTAQATMQYGNVTASGIFTFDAEGDMQSFTAQRYYDRPEGATLERWHIQNITTAERSGVRMPVRSEVTWQLKEGNFTWLKLDITEVLYNNDAAPFVR